MWAGTHPPAHPHPTHTHAQEFKPDVRNSLKRKRAQLLTIKRERELAQGINKRESRAADKRRMSEAGLGKF